MEWMARLLLEIEGMGRLLICLSSVTRYESETRSECREERTIKRPIGYI